MPLKGLRQVTQNLNAALAEIEGGGREGLWQAGLFVTSEAVNNAPSDTGTLRNSKFTDITAPNVRPMFVRVGFIAEYAAWVHEMVRRYDVGPQQDRSTSALVGPRRRRPRGSFMGPRLPRGRKRNKNRRPWSPPGTGPKFLQRAIFENPREILATVARYAQVRQGRVR